MKLNNSLDDILGSEKKVQILRKLFQYSDSFSGSHIARICNLPQKTVQRHINILEANDILNVRVYGKSRVFSLNEKNILYKALKKLFEAEHEVIEFHENIIKNTIEKSSYLRNRLAHASIYGSVLEGTETFESDLDLFLLFKDKFDEDEVQQQLDEVSDRIATISGTHLHWHAKNAKNINKINKQIVYKIKKNSKLIFGKKLEDYKVG